MGARKAAQHGTMAAAVAVIAIQFLPGPPRTNPPAAPGAAISDKLHPPPGVARLLDRSCADCHSNRTRWPWYSRIAPLSWMIAGDVNRGREVMNFSQWAGNPQQDVGLLAAACVDLERQRMPPGRYALLHPGSRPSAAEAREFCGWAQTEIARLAAAVRQRREAGFPPAAGLATGAPAGEAKDRPPRGSAAPQPVATVLH